MLIDAPLLPDVFEVCRPTCKALEGLFQVLRKAGLNRIGPTLFSPRKRQEHRTSRIGKRDVLISQLIFRKVHLGGFQEARACRAGIQVFLAVHSFLQLLTRMDIMVVRCSCTSLRNWASMVNNMLVLLFRIFQVFTMNHGCWSLPS